MSQYIPKQQINTINKYKIYIVYVQYQYTCTCSQPDLFSNQLPVYKIKEDTYTYTYTYTYNNTDTFRDN